MTLEELVENTPALPAAPEILPKLVKIMQDPDNDSSQIVDIISTDAAITAGVLKVSNSGAFSPSTPVTDIQDAIGLLGIKEVYRIVNMVTSSDFLDGSLSSFDIKRGGLWEHSLAVALMMDLICDDICPTKGIPYTLGLLHDTGKLLVHHGVGERYIDVFNLIESEQISIPKAETKILGFDHAAAGSTMLEKWNFPEEVYLPIRYQYAPQNAPEEVRALAEALQIANWAASVVGCNDGRDTWAIDMDTNTFGIDSDRLNLAIIEMKQALEKTIINLQPGCN